MKLLMKNPYNLETMKKRYDLKHPHHDLYNNYYVRYQRESNILNMGSATISDRSFIEREILIRTGDEQGLYYRTGKPYVSDVSFYKIELNKIEEQFKGYQQSKLNQGYEKPTEYPKELLVKKLQWESHLDVCNGELEILLKKKAELDAVIEKVDDSNLLSHGLLCIGHFWGTKAPTYELMGVLRDLDGQKVSQLPDGTLFIDDVRSPYNSMLVKSYRRLAKEFVADRMDKDAERLKKLQARAKLQGKEIPDQLPFEGRRRVSRSSLPAFPDWAERVETNNKVETTK
jgi:hypothetical protein